MTLATDHHFTDLLRAQMPLAQLHQLTGVEADTDRVVTVADWQPEHCGIGGVLHGGYLMAMADGTGATLAFVNLPEGATTTTVESKTNFFRPVTGGSVTATATVVHKGRTTMVVQTDITNDAGALVSRTLQTQAIRPAAV
jgi:1,4-dihydroxy-2-naphthoyl-CoA hydrolase